MKKVIKNSGSSYIIIKSIDLTLGPGESHVLTDLEKIEWANNPELLSYVRNGTILVGYWDNSFYTNAKEGELWLRTADVGGFTIEDSTSIVEFQNAIVQDDTTGVKSTTLLANLLLIMRELYNNIDNPFYSAGFQPFIGDGGREVEHLTRTLNLETIHSKGGWHYNQIKNLSLKAPKNILFYYGWLNSFNSSTNSWTNEKVAKDMSRYEIFVFGDGIQDPSHGDYSNTVAIISRLKVLNPDCLIFGYVSIPQTLTTFQTKVDQWDALHIDGIFMDEAGYDYGTNRVDFNTRVNYVHGKTYTKLCFVNSWNMDHILGTANDVSYPNSTWNPGLVESTLNSDDWYLLESFPVNTSAYSGAIETASDWLARGNKAVSLRSTYNINIASVGIINNDNVKGQSLFDFQYISALMFSLDGVGSSDVNYGSSSASVKFWNRIDVGGLEGIWTINPSVQSSSVNITQYERSIRSAILGLDFSSGYSGYVNRNYILSSGTSGYSGYSGYNGTSGYSGYGTSGYSGYSGMSGYTELAYGLSSNFTTTSTSATSTNLTFPVGTNENWIIDFWLTTQCSSTGGMKYAISAPAGSTIEGWILSSTSAITTNSYQRITSINTLNSTALHTVASAPGPDRIRCLVRTSSTSGNITLQAASVTSGQTTTIFANSNLKAIKASLL